MLTLRLWMFCSDKSDFYAEYYGTYYANAMS